MSNHHHTILYDPHGNEVEFREHFHKMMARSQNALRGRWENFWSSEEPCVIEVMSADDLLDKLVYVATNPVKDDLVDRVHHWPGPNFVKGLLTGTPMRARRPLHFFREQGKMPSTVELRLGLPTHFEGKDVFLAELRRRIDAAQDEFERERRRAGRGVLGRKRILRTSWQAAPTSLEPRRELRPRVAARNKWLRMMALQRNKEWQLEYRRARTQWLLGIPTTFPVGTYWLRRFAGVLVHSPTTN